MDQSLYHLLSDLSFITPFLLIKVSLSYLSDYRRIRHVKFLAFHGNQLEYNGRQGANGAG